MEPQMEPQKVQRVRAPKHEIFSWAMFDFANQAYTLLIITVVFSVIFPRVIVGDQNGADPEFKLGNLIWSSSLAFSYILVVLVGPVLGAMIDYAAWKKRFLFYSYVGTVILTASLFFVTPGLIVLGALLIILSNFFYSIGESFIASFLPDLGPPEDLGKISGFGWSVGYIGGLMATAAVILLLGETSAENFENLRYVGPLAAGFFLVCAIPTFMFVKERSKPRPMPSGETYVTIAFKRMGTTFEALREFRDLAVYLVSLFFGMAGLSIIFTFAFIYGDQVIGWTPEAQVAMFVISQLTAFAGAVFFGFIQDKIGAKVTFNITLGLWIVTVLLIYFTTDIANFANENFGLNWTPTGFFLFVGSLAGLGLGSMQSASRAIVGLFAPESKSAEFFGFWGLSGKLASAFGVLSLGILQAQLGLHKAILLCALFFSISFIITFWVNEPRGRKSAEEHRGM